VALATEGVAVSAMEQEAVRVPVLEHREVVVRRLLLLGLSPTVLRTLLPEFRPLIDRIAHRN
jgi:hypothetical protein